MVKLSGWGAGSMKPIGRFRRWIASSAVASAARLVTLAAIPFIAACDSTASGTFVAAEATPECRAWVNDRAAHRCTLDVTRAQGHAAEVTRLESFEDSLRREGQSACAQFQSAERAAIELGDSLAPAIRDRFGTGGYWQQEVSNACVAAVRAGEDERSRQPQFTTCREAVIHYATGSCERMAAEQVGTDIRLSDLPSAHLIQTCALEDDFDFNVGLEAMRSLDRALLSDGRNADWSAVRAQCAARAAAVLERQCERSPWRSDCENRNTPARP